VNDIAIRNILPTHAIRFFLFIDGKQANNEYIGDGLVVSTPFGSTAYFESITHKNFETGLGIAFNNTINERKPIYISEKSEIKIEIIRNEAHIVADNNPNILIAKPNDILIIRKAKETAKIIHLHNGSES